MDVIFETQKGRPFTLEIGFFDTVLEIKEKVQKYQGIPILSQTLVFNGQVLQDERDVEFCEILQNSRIQLLVAPEPDKPEANAEQSSPSKKIQQKTNIPPSSKASINPPEKDAKDTHFGLKEKNQEMEPFFVNPNKLVDQSGAAEKQYHQSSLDSEPANNTETGVNIKPSSAGSGTGSAGAAMTGSKKLKLMVLPKGGTKKIPVEVNASDNVGELRKELQKLHQRLQFHLPQEGYFFIYKQNVMDDDRSFRWHQVAPGDTIEIFNGIVTGGS